MCGWLDLDMVEILTQVTGGLPIAWPEDKVEGGFGDALAGLSPTAGTVEYNGSSALRSHVRVEHLPEY